MERLELHHIHAHGLDDLLAAHARADTHGHAAKEHEPDGDDGAREVGLAVAERHAEQDHADELLTILGAVHEAHGGGTEDLRTLEGLIRSPAIHVRANYGEQLADAPTEREAQSKAQEEAVDDLDPLLAVHAVKTALNGERGTGETGDEAMALARGDAEDRRPHAVDNDREQRGAQRDERHVRVRSEVNHV